MGTHLAATPLTPTVFTPRRNEADQPDLLELDDDPLGAWWNNTGPQVGISTPLTPLPREPPRTLVPGGGGQLVALGEAVRNAPPGI